MSSVAWLWAILYLCTTIALASDSLQMLREPPFNASESLSDASAIEIVRLPTKKSPLSVGDPPSSPSIFKATEESNAQFTCNADAYGSPNLGSCMTIWNGIPDSPRVISFGEREAPEDWDVVVPFRLISGERGPWI